MDTGVESIRSSAVDSPGLVRAILTASSEGLVLLDAAFRIHSLNDPARHILGVSAHETVTGRPWTDFTRPVPGHADPLARASVRGAGPVEGELDLPREGGAERVTVRVTACERNGGPDGAVVVFTGVPRATGQRAGRARADERRQWLERALKELPNAVYMVDLDDGRLIYENDMMQTLVGRPLPIGATPQARACEVPIRDAETGRMLDFSEYPSVRAARGESVREYPLIWITAHGPRDVSVTAHALPAGPGCGGVVMVSVTDLTPLKRIQRRLEDSEARLRVALASGDVGTWHVDLSNDVVSGSPKVAQIFDYRASQPRLPEIIDARVHPNDVARVRQRWFAAVATGADYNDEYRIRRTDGSVRWVFSRGRISPGVTGAGPSFSGVLADVTDRVRARRKLERAKVAAETANQAKTNFLANISHELRTPLGAILGFADLAQLDDVPEGERRQCLDIISRNGRALNHLIDDLLDLAKVEAGELHVEWLEVEPIDLLSEVLDLFREQARAKEISLNAHIAPGVPTRITSDPTRLRQILINVIGNAIKFTARGGVAVDVAHASGQIQIRVRDSGLGLTDEQRGRLFKPFVQADESTTRRYGGTGLGLALARRLARALGGDVTVEASEPGLGSIFLITFGTSPSH